jgi:hypothetical protein
MNNDWELRKVDIRKLIFGLLIRYLRELRVELFQ